jgi:hypothetical protein
MLWPKALLQADGRAKHPAIDADVLAEHDDRWIFRKRAGEREVDGFDGVASAMRRSLDLGDVTGG